MSLAKYLAKMGTKGEDLAALIGRNPIKTGAALGGAAGGIKGDDEGSHLGGAMHGALIGASSGALGDAMLGHDAKGPSEIQALIDRLIGRRQ